MNPETQDRLVNGFVHELHERSTPRTAN
jgi:hypothetical protein